MLSGSISSFYMLKQAWGRGYGINFARLYITANLIYLCVMMQNFQFFGNSIIVLLGNLNRQITDFQEEYKLIFIPRLLAIFFIASMSCQYCSLSAYSERLGCDWLDRACLFSSTQPRREVPGAGVSPRENFPVRRPLIISMRVLKKYFELGMYRWVGFEKRRWEGERGMEKEREREGGCVRKID